MDYDIPTFSMVVRILVLYSVRAGLEFLMNTIVYASTPSKIPLSPKLLLIKKTNTILYKIKYKVDRSITKLFY
jgi:hypothetical protein